MRIGAVVGIFLVRMVVACSDSGAEGSDTGSLPDVRDLDAGIEVGEIDVQVLDSSPEFSPVPFVKVSLIGDGPRPIEGPNAGARSRDYLLENARARFVIQGENQPRSWVPWTGSLIDADVVRPEGETGQDNLGELSIVTGILRSMRPATFEIVADGSDGEAAHLRVTGTDIGLPIVDSTIPFPAYSYEVVVDYVLAPDDNALLITTSVTSPKGRQVDLGDALLLGDRMRPVFPGFEEGPVRPALADGVPAYLAVGAHVAYGLIPLNGVVKAPIGDGDVIALVGPKQTVTAGGTVSYARLFVVGHDLEEVRARTREATGVEAWPLTLSLDLEDPQDASERAEVIIYDADDAPVAQAWLPADEQTFQLAPGTYRARTNQAGRPAGSTGPIEVIDGPVAAALTLPSTGRVEIAIGGDDFHYQPRAGLPCRVSVQAGPDADLHAGILTRFFSPDGVGSFRLPPGIYTLTAARGYEYEVVRGDVTVEASATATFSGTLTRSVHSEGWINADFHMHGESSADTTIPIEHRLLTLAAVGLERLPMTDHDTITDADPLLAPLGLDSWLRLTVGVEVSPVGKHSNAYPVTVRDDRPVYYGTPITKGYDEAGAFLGTLTFPEIWERMRQDFGAGILQINHPRDGQGYLDVIGYDPDEGVEALAPGVFSTDFDTIELINSGAIDVALEQIIPDWFSFLNQGIVKTGVGVSDSHSERNPGDARSYVRTGEDDPRAISDEALVEAVKAHRVVAASGPFLEAWIGEAGIGDAVAVAGPVDLDVRVQAPSWMPVDWLRVYVNGDLLIEEPVTGTEALRYEGAFALDVAPGDWVVVIAGAPDRDLAPVSPGQRVLSVANPIRIIAP